ncbi:MAG: PDZ domain-containing protein [Erysipelothrix sp.]|nr:PDZ domain-containing protein [Erysipelothrix sp.]
MKKTKELILSILALFLVITTVYLGSEVINLKNQVATLQQSSEVMTTPNEKTNEVVQMTTTISNSVSEVYDKVKDAVVTVKNYYNNQLLGSGSGVIYKKNDTKFYVVTNNHVITQGNKVEVILGNNEILEAKVLGSDVYADLAVLEVSSDVNVTPMVLGDSSLVNVGETVLAIGSPTGVDFSGSLAVGVISGKNRSISVDLDKNGTDDWDMIMLQTDAAINPGNSGGALVNMAGQLIGINTIKIIGNNVEGMGFANPVNEVVNIVSQLEKDGKVSRPSIGIVGRSMSELALYRNFYGNFVIPNVEKGLYIQEIVSNGPAQKAGLQAGDVIVKFDGQEVDQFKDFRQMLYQHKKGDTISVSVYRNNKTLDFKVTLD